MNPHEEKKQAKIAWHKKKAEEAKDASKKALDTAYEIGSHIPMGQPVLIGHHSEKKHRRALSQIDSAFKKSAKLAEKAVYHKGRAVTIESNSAISSDDPDAIEKLKKKIGIAKQEQTMMKEANKIIRKKGSGSADSLVGIGIPLSLAKNLLTPDVMGDIGFPRYKLQNNNANIRRMEKRLCHLKKLASIETIEIKFSGGTLRDSHEENRLQFDFNEKPPHEVRTALKKSGFRWAKTRGVWQSFRSDNANYKARKIIEEFYETY